MQVGSYITRRQNESGGVLKVNFLSKREDATGGLGKLHNKELNK
jgi:hypothetical protein